MGGADGDAVELGCHVARTGADEEAVGELWFLTPFSVRSSQQVRLRELRDHLVSLGLPSERLLGSGT